MPEDEKGKKSDNPRLAEGRVPAQADEASMQVAKKNDPILCIRSLLGKEIELINNF